MPDNIRDLTRSTDSQWRIQGVRDGATAPPWSGREVLYNICTIFISFVLRLKCKLRVPRLLVTVRVFCQLKTAAKCTQSYHFG